MSLERGHGESIGPLWSGAAAECGLAAIGLEVGRTLLLDRKVTVASADRAGLSIVGLESATS